MHTYVLLCNRDAGSPLEVKRAHTKSTVDLKEKGTVQQSESDLLKEIERMREALVELVKRKGFFSSEVVELSQQLDRYIVEAQYRIMKKSGKHSSMTLNDGHREPR